MSVKRLTASEVPSPIRFPKLTALPSSGRSASTPKRWRSRSRRASSSARTASRSRSSKATTRTVPPGSCPGACRPSQLRHRAFSARHLGPPLTSNTAKTAWLPACRTSGRLPHPAEREAHCWFGPIEPSSDSRATVAGTATLQEPSDDAPRCGNSSNASARRRSRTPYEAASSGRSNRGDRRGSFRPGTFGLDLRGK